MLTVARTVEMDGLKIGICAQPVKSGLTMLAALVAKYKEFKGLDAAFGIFLTDFSKGMIIARGNPRGIDVGAVVRALGGGGHPVVSTNIVSAQVEKSSRMDTSVKAFMNLSVSVVAPAASVREAVELMNSSEDGILPVVEDELLVGVLTRGNLVLHIYDAF